MKAMKLLVSGLFLLASACGTSATTSQVRDDQATDMPQIHTRCFESVRGAIVNDGAVELQLEKDGWAQEYLRVIQRDQFSGDQVLGLFLGIQREDIDHTGQGIDVRRPDVVYKGSNETHFFTLKMKKNADGSLKSGSFWLFANGQSVAQRRLEVVCRAERG